MVVVGGKVGAGIHYDDPVACAGEHAKKSSSLTTSLRLELVPAPLIMHIPLLLVMVPYWGIFVISCGLGLFESQGQRITSKLASPSLKTFENHDTDTVQGSRI